MLIIDADATPNIKEVEKICKENNVKLLLVCDDAHEMKYDYADVKICQSSSQAADLYIISNIKKDDILVTQDYGLATIVIDRVKAVINPKGFKYTKFNIDMLNLQKHQNQKNRKKGRYSKSKKRSEEDKLNYLNLIREEIEKHIKKPM